MKNLLSNLRFYVLVGSFWLAGMATLIIWLLVEDDRLAVIRIQEMFGFLSLIYLYVAILITPLTKSFPLPHADKLLFARRAIGVSAFTFGLAHSSFAFFDQFGGFSSLTVLTLDYVFAFSLGLFTLGVLFLMAATSFDAAIKKLGIIWWKRLHRLVYAAAISLLLHIYAIGSHFDDITSFASVLFLTATLFLLTLWAIGLDRHLAWRFGKMGPFLLSLTVVLGIFISSLLIARLVQIDVISLSFGAFLR